MENVPALAWKRGLPTLVELKKRLGRVGYHTSMIIAHAEGYGVPQLRRRLFLLAAKNEAEAQWPVPTFQISEPSYRQYQPPGKLPLSLAFTVEDAIGDLPLVSTEALDDEASYGKNPTVLYQSWARGCSPLTAIIPELSLSAKPSQPSFL
jgi:site-specific DNA-cytosine methylase